MRRVAILALCVAACCCVSAAAKGDDAPPPFVPITHFSELRDGAARRRLLDEYAGWLRLNGIEVAGPSNENEPAEGGDGSRLKYSLAVACADPEDECPAPIAALNDDAGESANLLTIPRRVMFGEAASGSPELRPQLLSWSSALEKANARGTLRQLSGEHGAFVNIVLQLLFEARVVGNTSTWAPWIATLPTPAETRHQFGLFLTEDERKCLTVAGRRIQRGMVREAKTMRRLVGEFCDHVNRETVKQRPDAADVDVSKIKIEPGTGCSFSAEDINWAYAVISARYQRTSHRFSIAILPFVDLMAYQPVPATQPGVVQYVDQRTGEIDPEVGMMQPPTEHHAAAAIDVIASRKLAAGDPLSFRTRFLEPIEALLMHGAHRQEQFEMGTPAWIAWDEGPQAERLDDMNCSSDPAATRVRYDGTFDDEILRCAELHVLRAEGDANATASMRAGYAFGSDPNVVLGAYDFLISHADLAIGSLPTREAQPQCFDAAAMSPLAKEVAKHNDAMATVFANFRARLVERRTQRAELQKAIDDAVAKADAEDAKKKEKQTDRKSVV